MKILEFEKYGVGKNLLDIYVKNGYIVINNDNASIVSNEFAVRLFLSAIDDNNEFAMKIAEDVSLTFSSYYLNMLYSLYDGDFLTARASLKKLKKKDILLDKKDEILMYDFILNDNDNDFNVPFFDNEYLKGTMKIIKKYIKLRQFKIAGDLLDQVLRVEKSKTLIILKRVLDKTPHKTKYIVDDNYQVNDSVTYEGIAALERNLIVSYEMGDYVTLGKNADLLSAIMHNDLFVKNIRALLGLLLEFTKNDALIFKHAITREYGDIDSVLNKCIKSRELYDVYDNINSSLDNSTFNTKLYLYKIILDDIMKFNKRNLRNVVVNGIGFNEAEESLDKYEELIDAEKFDEAKKILDDPNSGLDNYDYLIKEVDTMFANRDVQQKIDDICAYADSSNDPHTIIKNYETALMLQVKKDPIFYVKIAAAYEELGNYAEALFFLEDAEKLYAFPDTYLKMMELFSRCGRFDKVLEYHKKYETYYPEVNSYDYYLLSIAYMNTCKYDEAMKALDMAESINQEINGILYCFEIERDTIARLMKGDNAFPYTCDDFVSVEIDYVDEGIIAKMDSYLMQEGKTVKRFILDSLQAFDNIRDSMLYLLNIVKILVLSPQDYSDEIDFISEMIRNYETREETKKYTLEKLSIYKSVVKL